MGGKHEINNRPLHKHRGGQKGWHDIYRVLNEKSIQPRILYPARLTFRIEGERVYRRDRNGKKM